MTIPNADPSSRAERPPQATDEWALFQQLHPEAAANSENIVFVPSLLQYADDLALRRRSSEPAGLGEEDNRYEHALDTVRQAVESGVRPRLVFVLGTAYPTDPTHLTVLARLAQDTRTNVVTYMLDEDSGGRTDAFRLFEPPRASGVRAYWAHRPRPEMSPSPIKHNPSSRVLLERLQGDPHESARLISLVMGVPPDTIEPNAESNDAIRALLSLGRPAETASVSEMITTLLDIPDNITHEYAWAVTVPLLRALPAFMRHLYFRGDIQAKQEAEAIQERLVALLDGIVRGQRRDLERKASLALPRATIGRMVLDIDDPDLEPLLGAHIRTLFTYQGSIIQDWLFEQHYLLYRHRYHEIPEINDCITIDRPR